MGLEWECCGLDDDYVLSIVVWRGVLQLEILCGERGDNSACVGRTRHPSPMVGGITIATI